MLRIGIISDTHLHSFADLPKKLLQIFTGVDLIMHAGDLINLAILEKLKEIGPPVKAVWGNMDPQDVKEALPRKEIIPIAQFRIGLTHGSGAALGLIETVKAEFKHDRVDCIVYGHSHSPQNKVYQGILYFNPGSPTDKFFAPFNSYGILEIDQKIRGRIIKL